MTPHGRNRYFVGEGSPISFETVRGSGEEVARIHSVAAPKLERRTAKLVGAEGSKRDQVGRGAKSGGHVSCRRRDKASSLCRGFARITCARREFRREISDRIAARVGVRGLPALIAAEGSCGCGDVMHYCTRFVPKDTGECRRRCLPKRGCCEQRPGRKYQNYEFAAHKETISPRTAIGYTIFKVFRTNCPTRKTL